MTDPTMLQIILGVTIGSVFWLTYIIFKLSDIKIEIQELKNSPENPRYIAAVVTSGNEELKDITRMLIDLKMEIKKAKFRGDLEVEIRKDKEIDIELNGKMFTIRGEIADRVIDGTLCKGCLRYLGGSSEIPHKRYCINCDESKS